MLDGKLAGVIAVADRIKPASENAIVMLHAMDIKIIMITGDNKVTADAIARDAGIYRVIAEVSPGDKAGHVKAIQLKGKRVAMVGGSLQAGPKESGGFLVTATLPLGSVPT